MKLLEDLEIGDAVVVSARGTAFLAGVVSENELAGVEITSDAHGPVWLTGDLILTGDIEFRLLDYTDELRQEIERAGGPRLHGNN